MRATVSRWRWWALVVLVAVVLGDPVPAEAQGFYYKEIGRTGGSTSSTTPREAERFEKSGEVGTASRGRAPVRKGKRSSATANGRSSSISSSTASRRSSPSPAARPAHRVAGRQDADHDGPRLSRDLEPNPGRYTHEFPDDISPTCPEPRAAGEDRDRSASVERSSSSKGGSGFRRRRALARTLAEAVLRAAAQLGGGR